MDPSKSLLSVTALRPQRCRLPRLVIYAVPNELRPSVKMGEGYRQMSADDTRKMFAHFEDLNRSAKVAARNLQKMNCIDR